MDCAKIVKIYARNGKQGMKGCGKKGKMAHSFTHTPPACTLPLVNPASSICHFCRVRNHHAVVRDVGKESG